MAIKIKKKLQAKNKLTHFQEKSLSRVGVMLDEQELIRKIQNREFRFVKRSTRNITMWAFEYNKEMFNAVYDKERKEIVTILYDESNPKSRIYAFRGIRTRKPVLDKLRCSC